MNERQIKVIKKLDKPKPHPLYFAFCNAKSAAIELARIIAADKSINATNDVQRFVDEFGQKPA